MHFDFALFAAILCDLAKAISSAPPGYPASRDKTLREAAKALWDALDERRNDRRNLAELTPEEEVRLLHIME